MAEKYPNLINGIPVAPDSGEYFENVNPADREDIIGLFPKSGEKDIDRAVKAAQQAFPVWSEMPPPKRGELIFKAAEALKVNQEQLARVIVREMGKTMPESMGDIQSSIDVANFMAGEGRRMYGHTSVSSLYRRWAITKRVPVGVCGLITAWNAPMAIVTWKLFPALICGNTIVLKPSEDTPLTAHLLGELLKTVGFPDGVVNIVHGTGPKTGEALVKHKDVNLISFTGSTRAGKLISEECGKQLKKCSLELGGKNGLIVMDDADLDAASKAVAAGAFSTAGQRCASTSRVFVHEAVYQTFMDRLIDETKKMKIGAGTDSETKVCPIINNRQYNIILDYIEGAKQSGAKLVHGGKALSSGTYAKGNYIEPTIFDDVKVDSKLAQEEVFGPVLAVFRVGSLGEAIEKVNAVRYGLTFSIFTSNVNAALIALEKVEAGCCYINAPTFGSEPHMPFGGIKDSGNGTREPGTQAVDVFTEWKTIYIDYSGVAQNSQYKMK